jgi:hypothetical protein
VHIFHRMRKEAIQFLHIQENHLADYRQKLSIISKQSKLILKELRYQENIHAISNMPREKNPINFPNFFFKKKTQENKTCNMEMISYARQNQT